MRKLVPYTMPDGSRPASRLPVILSAVLAVAVVALLALNVYQYNTVSDLESQLYSQRQELTNVKADLTKAEHDIASMKDALLYEADSIEYIANHGTTAYNRARIVPDDGSGLFHRINCISLDPLELVLSPVLDRQTAQDLSFSPCPLCDDVNSLAFQDYAKNSNSVFDFVDRVRNADDQEWWTWCEVASEMLKQDK